jgi:heat shock protein HtpX
LFFLFLFDSGGRGRRGRGSSDRKGSGGAVIAILIAVALVALAWFLSIVIRFALSRSREFLADAGAVELTKNPDSMISALRKIEGRGELEGATSAVMEMCVDNPRSGFADLFATHPSIDARVKALIEFAGGHDPGPLAALPEPEDASAAEGAAPGGPWGNETSGQGNQADKPFLPQQPPVELGPLPPGNVSGPWGKPGGN